MATAVKKKAVRTGAKRPATSAQAKAAAPIKRVQPAPSAAKAVAAAPAGADKKAAKPQKTDKAAKAPKAAKAEKARKPKLVRDSFSIPKAEYAVLQKLKERAAKAGAPAKKSELLRAGIQALAGMQDGAFLAAIAAVPTLKTGRPAKA